MTTTVQGSLTVRRIKNGNDGAQGLKGCITRVYENGLVLNQEYRNDDADNTSSQDGIRYADFVAWQVDKAIVSSGYVVYQALHTFISNIDLPNYNEQTVEGITDSQGRKALKKLDINAATAFFNFILTRKIKADEIDVDNLIVKNVNAVSSDGTTTTNIDGSTGKLTSVDADITGTIHATRGQIAGLKIEGEGLTNEGFNNDAYIILRNDVKDTFVGVGGNVFPTTTLAKSTSRFENETPNADGANIGVYSLARNGTRNYALLADNGAVVNNGLNVGYGFKEYSFSGDNQWITPFSQGEEIVSDILYVNFNRTNCRFLMPRYYDVCTMLNRSDTTPFSMKFIIVCTGGSGFVNGRTDKVAGANSYQFPKFINATTDYDNEGWSIGLGDSMMVCLFYYGGGMSADYNYRAYVNFVTR